MKKRFLIALLLLLLLSTYNIQENFKLNSKFYINNITVENNLVISEKKIRQKLSFIYKRNLFFLRDNEIRDKLNEIDFIDSYEIKKIYPNKIKIKVFEKKPIAILQNKREKKYFTSKGSSVSFIYLDEFKSLPLVFGDEKSFKTLNDELEKINFPYKEIKTFYLFETGRWDLLTIKNQTIKLPISDYNISLKNFLDLKDQASFEKYKIFDYRIKDQLILK